MLRGKLPTRLELAWQLGIVGGVTCGLAAVDGDVHRALLSNKDVLLLGQIISYYFILVHHPNRDFSLKFSDSVRFSQPWCGNSW